MNDLIGIVWNRYASLDKNIEFANNIIFSTSIDLIVLVGTIFTGLDKEIGAITATVFGVILICIGVFF